MSKKVWIIAGILVATVAVLPLVGNMSIKKITDERIGMLEDNGVNVKSSDNGSSYFETRSHYEFELEDPVAFKSYIDSLSKEQVPAYLSAMLDDVVMAADVSYSNILMSSDVTLELYPVAFTDAAASRMQSEDQVLYAQMMEMLKDKEFLYHMDYDVSGEKFKGYIKDINREIVFNDGRKAKIIFESARFTGKGTLVKPERVDLKVKNADLDFTLPGTSKMVLQMGDLESHSTFSAKNSFDLDYKAKQLHFIFNDKTSELQVDASGLSTVSTSVVEDGKLNTALNAEVKQFKLLDQNGSLQLQDFAFVVDINGIDEPAYEAFQKASEQAGNSSQFTMLAAVGVISKGLTLDVKKLKVAQLAVNDSKVMSGFDHQINIVIKADDNLVQKIQISPLAMIQNIDIDAKLKFSTAFYSYLKMQNPQMAMADNFAKTEGDQTVFDVLLKEGQVTVNGESL